MEEVKNITREEVLDEIKNFPIEPTRSKLIITVNVEESDDIDLSGVSFSESQYVMASGSFAQGIKPGDKVLIDVRKMMGKNIDQIEIDPVEVNGRMYTFISDAYIKAIDKR